MSQAVLLFAESSNWGAISNFSEMFNLSTDYCAYEILDRPENDGGYEFGAHMTMHKITYNIANKQIAELANRPTTIFFAFGSPGAALLQRCIKDLKLDPAMLKMNVFWTGTATMTGHTQHKYGEWVRMHKVKQYAMLDLLQYVPGALPLMQTYNVTKLQNMRTAVEQNNTITICHSPGTKGRTNLKGTKIINSVVEELRQTWPNLRYLQLGSAQGWLTHDECLRQKVTCDIFIDKAGKHCAGGVGKSGIESICMGIPTLSAMHDSQLAAEYQTLHVLPANTAKQLKETLLWLLLSKENYESAKKQTQASAKLFDYAFVLSYLTQTMRK